MKKSKVGELSDEEIELLQKKKAIEREERVKKGFEELLEKEKCIAEIAITVSANGNFPQLNIIAKNLKKQ